MCRAHGRPGRFLPHIWVNAEPVPRFHPNAVTLTHGGAEVAEQRIAVEILAKSNLPGRWAMKDSFDRLDLGRLGFDVLREAWWIRSVMPAAGPPSDIVWQRETPRRARGETGAEPLPTDDPDFALFKGRRDLAVVAGGMLYRAAGVVGLTNVFAEARDAVAVWRALILLAAQTFPRLPVVGYESGDDLQAALDAGFELGDRLRIWVRSVD